MADKWWVEWKLAVIVVLTGWRTSCSRENWWQWVSAPRAKTGATGDGRRETGSWVFSYYRQHTEQEHRQCSGDAGDSSYTARQTRQSNESLTRLDLWKLPLCFGGEYVTDRLCSYCHYSWFVSVGLLFLKLTVIGCGLIWYSAKFHLLKHALRWFARCVFIALCWWISARLGAYACCMFLSTCLPGSTPYVLELLRFGTKFKCDVSLWFVDFVVTTALGWPRRCAINWKTNPMK